MSSACKKICETCKYEDEPDSHPKCLPCWDNEDDDLNFNFWEPKVPSDETV